MSPGGFNNWNPRDFTKSIGIGALSGAATFGVGQVFGNVSTFANEVGRGLAHGAVQGGASVLGGGDFWSGFASGTLSSWAGSAFSMTSWGNTKAGIYGFSALAGGIGAAATGGNFWQGAANGLMVGALNQLQQDVEFYKMELVEGRAAAYRQMWRDSYPNGVPTELGGFELENDYFLIQYSRQNGRDFNRVWSRPYMEGGRIAGRAARYRGRWYRIKNQIHTHPNPAEAGGIGIASTDIRVYRNYQPLKIGMRILHNRTEYILSGSNPNYVKYVQGITF